MSTRMTGSNARLHRRRPDPEQRTFTVNVLVGDAYVAAQPETDGTIASRVIPGLIIDPADVVARLD
jgi:hypothetical protein